MLIRQVHQKRFSNKGFNSQQNVCNWCHDVLMMSMSLCNIAILNIQGVAYRCIINRICKSEALALLNNVNPNEKVEHYKA